MTDLSSYKQIDVVIVDDDPNHIKVIKSAVTKTFTEQEIRVSIRTFQEPDVALSEVQHYETPQVILIDYQLGGTTGIEWLADFIRANVGPVIMMTSSGDERIAAQAFRIGASDYINKLAAIENPQLLSDAIKRAMRKCNLEHTNRQLNVKLRQLNESLHLKNRKLQDLTDTAHRFVEDVAHEFRTPLTVISEFTSIILDGIGGETTDKQNEYLQHVLGSTRDLAGLIEDFLNSSRLRCGNIRVNKSPHTLSEIVESIRSAMELRASSKQIELDFSVPDPSISVYIDLDKACRSLQNLIVNAIKYSGPGSHIRVSVAIRDEHSVHISVSDQGPGIDKESIERLISRFSRGSKAEDGVESGYGLGLSIVSELVRINYGELTIESELGEGSTFGFTVPLNNEQHILHCLMNLCPPRESERLCVFSVTRDLKSASEDSLVHDLRSIVRPMDLMSRMGEGQAHILIAYTDYPDRLMDRLIDADQKNREVTHRAQEPKLKLELLQDLAVGYAIEHGIEALKTQQMLEINNA